MSYAKCAQPVFCGKPEAIFFHELCQRLHVEPSRCLLIGDNLESDIAGAKRMGMQTILTMTGVTRESDLPRIASNHAPARIVRDLSELL
jgi:4-nitrophenyl phosphatase